MEKTHRIVRHKRDAVHMQEVVDSKSFCSLTYSDKVAVSAISRILRTVGAPDSNQLVHKTYRRIVWKSVSLKAALFIGHAPSIDIGVDQLSLSPKLKSMDLCVVVSRKIKWEDLKVRANSLDIEKGARHINPKQLRFSLKGIVSVSMSTPLGSVQVHNQQEIAKVFPAPPEDVELINNIAPVGRHYITSAGSTDHVGATPPVWIQLVGGQVILGRILTDRMARSVFFNAPE